MIDRPNPQPKSPYRLLLTFLTFALLAGGAPDWAQAPSRIEPEPGKAVTNEDSALAEKIRDVFGQMGGLEELDVAVHSGVVKLSGPVLSADHEARAIAIAEKLDGVIAVETDIVLERNLRRRLMPILEDLQDQLLGWLAALPVVIVAAIVALLFWWLGRFLSAREGLTRRWAPNAFVADFLKLMLHGAVFVFGLVLALEIVGASAFLGSILGALGLVGLAVGIAVRDTVENFIASLLLSVRQPFAPQDHVLIEGHEGRVARLTSRATILMNLEGNHVRIPNALVYKGTIVNYTRNPNRRFDFEVGIATEGDPAIAQSIALAALQSIPTVLTDPEPACVVSRLGDSNIVLTVLGWVDQTQTNLGKTKSAAINAVKLAFERNGIGMPEPIYSINMSQAAAAEPTAKDRPAVAIEAPDLEPNHDLERQTEIYAGGQDLLDARAPQE